jgi:hypothetical protein
VAPQLCRATAGGAAAMPAALLPAQQPCLPRHLLWRRTPAAPPTVALHHCLSRHWQWHRKAWRSQQAQKLAKIPAEDQIHKYIGIQSQTQVKYHKAQAKKCSKIHILANMIKIKLKLTNTRTYITNTFKFEHHIMHKP